MTMRKTLIKILICAAIVVAVIVLAVLIMAAMHKPYIPYERMYSLAELKSALSGSNDSGIIFPDLSGFDLTDAGYALDLLPKDSDDYGIHDGYAISEIKHPELKYHASSSIYVSRHNYKFSPFPHDMLPLDANRTYKDVLIEYYTESGLYKIPESAPEGMYEKGSLVGDYHYKFVIGSYLYLIDYFLYFPPEALDTVDLDTEQRNAEEIYFEIVKSIIDQKEGS